MGAIWLKLGSYRSASMLAVAATMALDVVAAASSDTTTRSGQASHKVSSNEFLAQSATERRAAGEDVAAYQSVNSTSTCTPLGGACLPLQYKCCPDLGCSTWSLTCIEES